MEFSKCTMYNFTESADGNNVTECLYGWEFDKSIISSSIVIDVMIVYFFPLHFL
jgi:hypothetical protein